MVIKAIYSGLKHLFKRRMTVKYPDQKLKLPERFLGRHILDIHTCIHCQACARICPTKAITMNLLSKDARENTGDTDLAKKKKRKEVYPQISYALCVFCGLCVDECPKNFTMSREYELSAYEKESLVYTPEQLSEIPSEDEGRYTIKFTKRGVSHAD